MKITFDHALDGPAWPGPHRQSDFVFGEVWLGPMGFLDVLETRLGLGGQFDGALQRACRLATQLRDLSGYWRPSFDVDPLGTCRRLLRERDDLWLWGWTGQPISPRLRDLGLATANASPGVPNRLVAIVQALARRSANIESVVSYTVISHLPPLWREVFRCLQDGGAAVEERTLPPSCAIGDLDSARTRGFAPQGDGRFCLLRRHGPLDVADEVAASLAACDTLDGVVVIGGDSILDLALVRHGVPRVGGDSGPPSSTRLLSLVLEAAFHPMEMRDLHALLTANPGPIPRFLASYLVDAIRDSPGRRTSLWSEALTQGLLHIDEDKRADLEKRVMDLVWPLCGRNEELPVSALRKRVEALAAWARAHLAYVPSLLELSQRIQTLVEAVDLLGSTAFSWHQLRRLCDDLGEPSWPWRPAEVGLASVARPGAILAPARAIVWWNFSRDAVPRSERLRLSRAERDGLSVVGVEPPDASLAVAIQAAGWRRPLSQAQGALILACPLTTPSGEPNNPHPLWDDVTASLADVHDIKRLERQEIVHPAPARRVAVAQQLLLAPAAVVMMTAPIVMREVESASSIEKLIGCSLSWALEYRARLRPGLSTGPQLPGPMLFGALAHRILAQVLGHAVESPDEAAELAETTFDRTCHNLCEDLALPQYQANRATLRRAVVESARELQRLALKHGARGIRTEVPGTATVAGQAAEGRLDLVWEDPAVVLDLKWGKTGAVKKLETGTAVQLAIYAGMREAGGQPAETAYFALQTQELLAEPGGRLAPDAKVPGAHGASQVWSAATASLELRRVELTMGRIEAPGTAGTELKPALLPGGLQLAPCQYCDFGGICGRRGAR